MLLSCACGVRIFDDRHAMVAARQTRVGTCTLRTGSIRCRERFSYAPFARSAKSVLTQQKNICAERLGMGTDVRKRCMKSVEGEALLARRSPLYIPTRCRKSRRSCGFAKQTRVEKLYRDVQFFKPVAASIAVCDTYIPPSVPVMA